MSRAARASLASETLRIIKNGGYVHPERGWIELKPAITEGVSAARLIEPDGVPSAPRTRSRSRSMKTSVAVRNETTLAGSRSLVDPLSKRPPLCLNFASAKSPGGGFLSGAEAQEESIARSSTLYPTLIACPGYYEANDLHPSPLYTDKMILSPRVTVFRDDDGNLTREPFDIAVLTSPAPNAGAARERSIPEHEIERVMSRRVTNVLTIAATHGYTKLVLGAWGCGVFRNNPAFVAGCFATTLQNEFHGAFEDVRFSILDAHSRLPFLSPFMAAFPTTEESKQC